MVTLTFTVYFVPGFQMKNEIHKNLQTLRLQVFHQTIHLAPRVGLEPTTPRLTAVCSTIELSRNAPMRSRIAKGHALKAKHQKPTTGHDG